MLTGLEIIQIMASGQCFAQAVVKVATMLALVLNRSSRVIPRTHPAEYFKSPAAYSLKGRLPNQSVLLSDMPASAPGFMYQEKAPLLQ